MTKEWESFVQIQSSLRSSNSDSVDTGPYPRGMSDEEELRRYAAMNAGVTGLGEENFDTGDELRDLGF